MTVSRRLSFVRACHRVLLWMAPAAVRHGYGAEMRATFHMLSEAADARGTLALLALLWCELLDVLTAHRHSHHVRSTPVTRTATGWLHIVPAVRSLLRRPAYATGVILTLAFGTAATTAMFTVVETVLLRPLPYPDGDRLVSIMEASPTAPGRATLAAPGRIENWHRMNATFSDIASSYLESVTDTSLRDPERLSGLRVTPRYFTVFGAAPLYGRTFIDEEEVAGGPRVVIISEPFWSRRFARDPAAVGQTLTIGGVSHTIVGVVDRTFATAALDIWLPAQMNAYLAQLRDARFVSGVGRLRPGVTIEQARADLERVQSSLGEQFPATDRGWTAVVSDLRTWRVGDRGTALWLVFGAVAIAWLVAIANVAGLVLVHAQRRTRELAIRTALGASRAQVIAVVVQEILLLTAVGAGAGLALASVLVGLVPQVFATLPRINELAIDWRSALFAVVSSLAAALVCAVWPASHATRRRTTFAHAEGSRGSTATAHWSQRVLVGAQVALGVVLCTSAALLSSSYYTLTAQDLGLDPGGVVTFRIGARWDEDRARVGQMQEALFERIAATPGVSAIGMTNFLPEPVGTLRYQVAVAGLGNRTEHGAMTVGTRMVSKGYHDALRVPLLAGATCPRFHYDFKQPRLALINRQFVDRYGQGQNLVGRPLTIEGVGGAGGAYTVVGVIGDVAEDGAQTGAFPFVYTCSSAGAWPDPHYVVRTANPDGFMAAVREIVRGIDSTRAVFGLRPLSAMLHASIAEPRLNAGVVTAFAMCALLLGALGLYTLFARLVTESRREIGVRLALGATPADVLWLVVSQAGRLLALGIAAGIVVSLGVYQVLQSSLHQTTAFDLTALGVAVLTLTTVSGIAILLPAMRASRVPPTEALRSDGG